MADNSAIIGKWLFSMTADAQDENAQQPIVQFYKDGSCLIPAALLGKDDLDFIFYQVFENGMMKLESGSMTPALYRCALAGDTLTLTSMDGVAFSFVKVQEEKRSFFKMKAAEPVAPVKEKQPEPEAEREPEEHEWKCPNCGKINQNYVGTCGCGELKPKDKPAFNWMEVHPELVPEKPAEEEPVVVIEEVEEEKPKKPDIPEREPEEHEWKCPNCGKINQNYVGTCGCGELKPKDKPAFNWAEVHPELVPEKPAEEEPVIIEEVEEEKPKKSDIPEREPEEHEWKCPKCGKINQNYVGTCGCGELKPKDKPAFNWAEVHPELVPEKPAEEPVIVAEEPAEKKSKKNDIPEREPEEHEWKCPNCGKINQNYVGTCGCGELKPKDKPAFNWAEVHPELIKEKPVEEEPVFAVEEPSEEKPAKDAAPEREAGENEWKCPNCGKINQNYVGTCGCGQGKPKTNP